MSFEAITLSIRNRKYTYNVTLRQMELVILGPSLVVKLFHPLVSHFLLLLIRIDIL